MALALLLLLLLLILLASLSRLFSPRLPPFPSPAHLLVTDCSHPALLALAKLSLLRHGSFVSLLSPTPLALSSARSFLLASAELHGCPSHLQDRIFSTIADVRDPAQAASAIQAASRWRPVDVIVFSQRTDNLGLFDEMKIEEIGDVTPSNIMGAVYVAHAAIPFLKQRRAKKRSALVFITSAAGLSLRTITRGARVDSLSDYALKGLADMLRFELLQYNVGVHLVCPGAEAAALLGGQATCLQEDKNCARMAEKLASAILEAVKGGQFLVTTGIDGFLAGVLMRGIIPAESCVRAITEFVLMLPLRLLSIVMRYVIFSTKGKPASS